MRWCTASFDVAFFFAATVLFLHLGGGLVAFLSGLDTLVGSAAYLWMWGVAWLTHRRAVRGLAIALGRPGLVRWFPAGRAVEAGVLTGLLFLAGIILVLIGEAGAARFDPFIVVFIIVAAAVATAVGAASGLVLVAIHALVVRLGGAMADAAMQPGPADPDHG